MQVKSRRDRYTVPISVQSYEEMQRKIALSALRDGVLQGIAICMMALEMVFGWRRGRLTRFYYAVCDILHMPKIMGKDPTADDAIARMRDLYHIDLDKLEIDVDLEDKKWTKK